MPNWRISDAYLSPCYIGRQVDNFLLGVATATRDLATGILGLSPPASRSGKVQLASRFGGTKTHRKPSL